MKTYPLSHINMMIAVLVGALIVMAGCSKDPVVSPMNDPASDYGNYKLPELAEDEIDDLLYMVQEERLAFDMYNTLYIEYELKIFQQIANSEEKHVAALSELISKYDLTNPNDNMDPGEYLDGVIQALYDQLLEQAMLSRNWAIQTGIDIESLDITDLNTVLARTDAKNLLQAYNHLVEASEKHLESFTEELN